MMTDFLGTFFFSQSLTISIRESLQMTLEEAIGYVASDELIEVSLLTYVNVLRHYFFLVCNELGKSLSFLIGAAPGAK